MRSPVPSAQPVCDAVRIGVGSGEATGDALGVGETVAGSTDVGVAVGPAAAVVGDGDSVAVAVTVAVGAGGVNIDEKAVGDGDAPGWESHAPSSPLTIIRNTARRNPLTLISFQYQLFIASVLLVKHWQKNPFETGPDAKVHKTGITLRKINRPQPHIKFR